MNAAPRRGLTLLELLLVTVILGLIASLGAGALLRATQAEPLRRGVAGLQEADRQARLEARQHGPRLLRIEADGWWLERPLVPPHRLWTAPEGLRVTVRDAEGRSLDQVAVDAAGRGPDLQVELHDGHRPQRFRLLGLSGQWVEDRP